MIHELKILSSFVRPILNGSKTFEIRELFKLLEENYIALDMAIKALEQEPVYFPSCVDCNTKMNEIREAYDKLKNQAPCEDAISREDALMCLTGEIKETDTIETIIARFVRRIRKLPPVNPQPICEEREKGECPYYAG